MTDMDDSVRLRTGWEIKLLALSAAVLAVATVAAVLLMWDALVLAEQGIEAVNAVERELVEHNKDR